MIDDRRIARRYAKAFLHGGLEKEGVERLADEFRALVDIIDSDETVSEFFKSPLAAKKNKIHAVRKIGAKLGLSPFTVELLEILIKKDRIGIIDAVADELHDLSDRINDRVRVFLTTANEPSVDEIAEIAERIGGFFKRQVTVERSIDPAIIGGFILQGDGKLIDLSVRGQIGRILTKMQRKQADLSGT
ncbi:MAG: ATP synthase F1 subunit delta [Candidatus Latescibacteria bacterium]|nr:ATP synthase F1 subunit delta [Candidatus Latescibacterota bacterium]